MTRIRFRRTGGITGREIDTHIDMNALPDADMQEVQQYLLDSNFLQIPQNLIQRITPDEYEYIITVDAGNTHHTIHTSDASAPESLRPLLRKLSLLAKENDSKASDVQ